ncbi:hypothetical protein AB3S75_022193 [Citrus x aurantiifolia]
MAKPSQLSVLLVSLVILFRGCLAANQQQWQQPNDCQINNLEALEPNNRVECEAGVVETWDPGHEQFQCAGVAVVRHTIRQNGLLLPQFSNSPQLVYILQGEGLTGTLFPGCPATFQSPQQGGFGESAGRSQQDSHQKIRRFRQGDIFALPAGVAHWCYNEGSTPVVAVVLLDVANNDNQLDRNPRKFHLAGNPHQEFQQQRQQEHFGGHQQCNNVFCGFDTRILAEAFNVEERLVRRLRSEKDYRGAIVTVRGQLQVARPPRTQSQREYEEDSSEYERSRGRYGGDNGVEETMCTTKLRENIGDPSKADIYTQGAGHITTLNSFNLPVLRWIQLSAERNLLHRNAMMVPHWNLNAHSIMYAISGSCHVQVVDSYGRSVYDGEVRRGQIMVVPQNFAVVKRARGSEFEWISFKTNDNAMISPLSGRTSVMRGMPEEILANAFQISREDARRIKYNNQQTTVIRSSQSQMRDEASVASA